VLFARDPRADAPLAAAFASREVEKVYRAVTARPPRLPPFAWTVDAPLAARHRRVVVDPLGAPAETAVRRIETGARALLVEARPRTGRKHQVRVHLAASSAPILGDAIYAPSDVAARAERVLLHAARLALRHPLTGRPLVVEAADPPDLAAAIAELRRA
jgi:23S rRNA-/tRNA-specific pseudouridylate synthase